MSFHKMLAEGLEEIRVKTRGERHAELMKKAKEQIEIIKLYQELERLEKEEQETEK